MGEAERYGRYISRAAQDAFVVVRQGLKGGGEPSQVRDQGDILSTADGRHHGCRTTKQRVLAAQCGELADRDLRDRVLATLWH
nr:hypothetical protein [Roseomonas sp. KE2513]